MAQGNLRVTARRILGGVQVEGEPDEMGNVAIYHAGRERGSLYVLVSAQGARSAEVEPMLLDAITDFYQHAPSSVTGALQGAIKEANAVLYDDNQKSMRNQQTYAGVYCVLVRPGQDLVLAFAGPSAAMLIAGSQVDHLPSGAEQVEIRAAGQLQTASTALGVHPDIDPILFSSRFEAGDMLLMATPSLLETGIDDEELANAINEEGVAGLPTDRDSTVLLLSYPQPGAQAALAEEEAVATDRSRVGSLAVGLAGLFRPHPRPSAPEAGEAAPVQAQPAVAPEGEEAAPLPAWLDDGTPVVAKPRYQQRTRLSASKLSPRMVAVGAAVAAVVILIVVAIVLQQQRQAQAVERKYQDLMGQAETAHSLGLASFDRTQALAHLNDAAALVSQALGVKPTAPDALALRDEITRDMDEAKGVTHLDASQVNILYTFTAAGTGPTRIVGDGANLYVLDRGDQKVYKFVLNAQGNAVQSGGDSILMRKGDQIEGAVIGDLVDLAWIPAGGSRRTSNLVVLDSGGNLVQYDPSTGLTLLPVKDASSWRKVQATGGYGGNFYVLDPLASSIMRYRPEGRGYEGAPTEYLQAKTDLTNAVDMAIDGDIFVLMVNGEVLWLSGGKPQPFSLEGLDTPMAAPVSIFTNEGTNALYVTDPSNSRIVQLSKQGVTQRQWTYDESFQRLRGIFADEQKNAVYATVGTQVVEFQTVK